MGAEMRVRSRPQTDLFRTFINLPKSGCWLTVFLSIPTWQAEIATRCTLTVGKALILSKSSCRKHNTPANRTENGNSVCAPELKHIPFLIIRRARWRHSRILNRLNHPRRQTRNSQVETSYGRRPESHFIWGWVKDLPARLWEEVPVQREGPSLIVHRTVIGLSPPATICRASLGPSVTILWPYSLSNNK